MVSLHPRRRDTGRLALIHESAGSLTRRASAVRRADESSLLPIALEILDLDCDRGALTLATLQRVHAKLVDAPAGIGGRLRDGAAVVRLDGVAWFVPPAAAIARGQAEALVATLVARLTQGLVTPAPDLAAEAMARLTDLHPFADGNGRVARVLATWLLMRAGYRPKGTADLGDFCRLHRHECFRALRNHETDPSTWDRFFRNALSACFVSPLNALGSV